MIFLRLSVLAILMFLVFAAPASAQEKPVFRNFIWGVSKEDVRSFESARWYKDEGDSSFFVTKPDKFRRTIRYDFRDGKLWRGYYGWNELHYADPMKIFEEGAKLQVGLEKIYGEPTKEEFEWVRTRYRNAAWRLGTALRSGDVRVRTVWELPGSRVVMEFYHDGVLYQLHYTVEDTAKQETRGNNNILNMPLGNNPQP